MSDSPTISRRAAAATGMGLAAALALAADDTSARAKRSRRVHLHTRHNRVAISPRSGGRVRLNADNGDGQLVYFNAKGKSRTLTYDDVANSFKPSKAPRARMTGNRSSGERVGYSLRLRNGRQNSDGSLSFNADLVSGAINGEALGTASIGTTTIISIVTVAISIALSVAEACLE
jgi:hypothetical protein